MTYSCSDFTDDVLNCLVEAGAIEADAIPDNNPGGQADLVVAAIISMHRAALGARFVTELLGEVESLGAVAEQYGVAALAVLFYLQAAVVNGSYVEADAPEMGVITLVKALPSADEWMKHVHIVPGDS